MTSAAHAPIDIEALRRARTSARLGHAIHYFDTIGSTSDEVRDLALAGADEGVVAIAEMQTRGRGRLGRRWESPPFRNLYLSVLLRPPIDAEHAPQIALVAGLAAAEAVREWAPTAQIKWPNDVLVDGRKLVGILAETQIAADGSPAVVVGIGVNLNLDIEELPEELRTKATSLRAVTGARIDRGRFADVLLSRLEDRYIQFCTAGFGAVRGSWDDLSCLTGASVRIAGAGTVQEGTVLGLADDGTLRLRSADGCEMRVVAGDVTVLDGYSSDH